MIPIADRYGHGNERPSASDPSKHSINSNVILDFFLRRVNRVQGTNDYRVETQWKSLQMNEIDDQIAVLVVRCQLGERDAWEELVHRWHQPLWRFMFGMLGNRQAAEDVLQIVWLRVVQSLVRLREPARFEAWIYRVARNVIADRLRAQYRRPLEETFEEAVSSDHSLESIDLTNSLHHALGHLHPIDRETTVLYYFHEKSLDEVAGICEVPEGTVKSRLHRARLQLREILGNEEHCDK